MTRRPRDARSPSAGPAAVSAGPAAVLATAAVLAAPVLFAVPALLLAPAPAAGQQQDAEDHAAMHAAHHGPRDVAIVIHGGAGSIREVNMTQDEEEAYRSAMSESLEAGRAVLEDGGTSVDACVAAIRVLETSPLFNAGIGAVFTSEGTVEHDASIMDGGTRNSGAVAGVQHVRSPIALARVVMDSSRHVMFAREGAETFAREHGFERVPNETFYSEERKREWERRQREGSGGPRSPAAADGLRPDHLGTVGCAALDRQGNLAAGTSTGGTSDKRWGRIGDSPIIGAGTYADNRSCAVSATGHGEYFIRGTVAHDVCAMMRYAGLSLAESANAVIHGHLTEMGGTGGVISIDRDGHIAMPFNTAGMYRGYIDAEGNLFVAIYSD